MPDSSMACFHEYADNGSHERDHKPFHRRSANAHQNLVHGADGGVREFRLSGAGVFRIPTVCAG